MLPGAAKDETAAANRRELAHELGFEEIIMPKLAHGRDVYVLRNDYDLELRPEADAIVTNKLGRLVGVATADCVAILIYDPIRKAVAALHSGWRGTHANVVQATLSKLTSEYGTRPADVIAYISAAPNPREYEVGTEVAKLFSSKYIVSEYNQYWFDNKKAIYAQLTEAGVDSRNIEQSDESSFNNKFHSYRRDGAASGRHVAVIGLIKD